MFYGALASSAAALPARMIELQYHDNTEADKHRQPPRVKWISCSILNPSKRANIYPGNKCGWWPAVPSSRGARVSTPQEIRFVNARSSWRGFVRIAPIDDELIAEIHARMDKTNVIRNTNALNPGDKVVIQSGLLRNFVGVFERNVPGAERVQILLRSVAYSAHVEVSCLDVARAA